MAAQTNKLIWCLWDNVHTCKHKECCYFCKNNKKCEMKCCDYQKQNGCKYLIEAADEDK